MKHIKFSKDYEKLPPVWNGTQAHLIAVFPCNMRALKLSLPSFIKYDTKVRNKEEYYPLDFEEGLILVFIHHITGIPFTTIRRNYTEKFNYYTNSIGQPFVLTSTNETQSV